MRSWLVVSSLAVVAVAAPSAARAELGGGALKIEIKIPSDPEANAASMTDTDYITPTEIDRLRYFNLARCTCDNSGDAQNYLARISWETVPTTSVSGTQLFLYTGTGCESGTLEERANKCTQLTSINDATEVTEVVDRYERMRPLLTPNAMTAGCDTAVTASAFNVYTSTDGGNTLTVEKSAAIQPVDLKAPALPASVTVSAQEGQISLAWDRITSGADDYEYFQALCATPDGAVAHASPTHEAQFDTTYAVCGTSVGQFDALTLGADVDGTPVTFATLPADLAQLDSAFLCGQAAGSAQSITLSGLTNEVPYVVILLAMDKSGNYTAGFVPRTIAPQPVTDFWEDLNNENGELEGGLCLIETTFGSGGGGLYGALRAWRDELGQSAAGRWLVDRYYAWGAPVAAAARESVVVRVVVALVLAPLIVIALAWHALGLPALLALALAAVWWRRRGSRRGGARRRLAVAGALTLAPSLAAAQNMTPYWDDSMAAETSVEPAGPRWHVGLRLGPYLPDIDDDRFGDPGPYERMFGDGSWMPALDVHRVFTTRYGQLGGGLSVGYFGKTADAFVPGTTVRSPGNENTLRIVPMELTAIYRASQLDDNWGIPLVPYVRGGLAYALWWVRRPDGDLAKACGDPAINCDRAIGGSLGLVGAAGLAIRAERIDAAAARSMRDSGLEHAGFYAEVELAWVDGFGSAKKLSVGDTTWFAGIDFEF